MFKSIIEASVRFRWFVVLATALVAAGGGNLVAAGATPKQFGLRVKSHSVLTVTSRAKMRNARAMQLTYSGDLLQTIVQLRHIHSHHIHQHLSLYHKHTAIPAVLTSA